MLLVILMAKKLYERFTKKKLQLTNQKEFRAEKVIKKKRDLFYAELKGCDKSFNTQINKNDIKYKISKIFRD